LDVLGFGFEFFWPWPWFQVLVLGLVLEHKVLDNITGSVFQYAVFNASVDDLCKGKGRQFV